MKENIKRIINLIILIAIAFVTFIFVKSIPNFLIQTADIEKTESAEIQEMAPGAVFILDQNTAHEDGDVWVVTVPGISQIYCAEKGAHFSRLFSYTYEGIVDYVNQYNGKTTTGSCGKPEDQTSYAYYKVDSRRQATQAEAYIVTYPVGGNYNGYSKDKQYAVWGSTLSKNKTTPGSSGEAQKILDESKDYGDFANNELGKMSGASGSGNNVKVSVSQPPTEYIVGPFTLNYGNGDYGNVAFGGISNMYLQAESGQIAIKSFIIGNTEITPSYFTPDSVEYVDRSKQQYPKPGEEFYVKFVSDQKNQIINLHVDFKWMETKATITYYKSTQYKAVFECSHTYYCPGHEGSHNPSCSPYCTSDHRYTCDGCQYDCTVSGQVQEFNPEYQEMLSAEGTRTLKSSSINIAVNKTLQIKLAGHVWVDEGGAKETEVNGFRDIDEKNPENSEKVKPGVEVILHEQGGSEVARTVTDINGYYEFNDLNAQKKYYVEFVYDGQIYQATKYDTSIKDEAVRLAGWKNNATEDPNERINFNKNFTEIGSAPGNYTVRRQLTIEGKTYKKVGETNTAWIVEKSSSETPYGIKEIYEYLIQQAVKNKSYSEAYKAALKEYGNNSTTWSKLQFIEDCRISSYTGYNGSRVNYPIWDNFNEDDTSRTVGGVYYPALYPTHLQIDFGLNPREQFDLALRKDVEKATIEINGKTHTYTYDTRKDQDENDNGTWDISVRLSDASYYNTQYSREIFGSDYQYKVSNYDNAEEYGKTKADELNVYVTYKLTVRNQSQSVLGEVMEIVDYFDEDYMYVNDENHSSYIEIKNGAMNVGKHDINVSLPKEVIDRYIEDYGEEYVNNYIVENKINTTQDGSGSIYGNNNTTNMNENNLTDRYDTLYINGLQGKKLTSGQTAYIYLTFKIKKDTINGEDWIRLDETLETATATSVGKENIAEINGFRTYYRNGTYIPNVGTVSGYDKVAGLFDKDSVPGNLNPSDVPKDTELNKDSYKNFEDDTDKAPNIRLILYRDENGNLLSRTIDGVVWEDERNVTDKETGNSQKTAVGNGIKDSDEPAINGVTVQLVELMDNGTEFVWKTFSSGQYKLEGKEFEPIINLVGETGKLLIPSETNDTEGIYIFKSYPTGNYVVRFIYGDTEKTVLPNSANSNEVTSTFGQSGQNDTSYNGQDYKSTTYQAGVETSKEFTYGENNITAYAGTYNNGNAKYDKNESGTFLYDITTSEKYNGTDYPIVSDAKDIESRRNEVINYSDDNVMNYIAEVLASHERLPLDNSNRLQELMNNTKMKAETGVIDIEVEYDRNATGNQVKDNSTSYAIQNVNLGLEERPKAQLAINKKVTNIKLTLADGSTLFDATQKATNVLWREHKAYEFKYTNEGKVTDYQLIQEIRTQNAYEAQYGLIQLTMDEELMHGATIKISYKITVTNVGEADYKDNQFYYTGIVSNPATVVKTQANQVIDYVANNLQFYAVDNSSWSVIEQESLLNGLVNMTWANEIAKYNTIITTNENSNIAKTALVPEIYDKDRASVSDDLVLTQLITSENETDDLTYRNIVEIVKTSNDVGRRMALSIVGNQNPNKDADITEVDADRAEIVKILPPYGNAGMPYIIGTITILAAAILITGIIFIKKKVLK